MYGVYFVILYNFSYSVNDKFLNFFAGRIKINCFIGNVNVAVLFFIPLFCNIIFRKLFNIFLLAYSVWVYPGFYSHFCAVSRFAHYLQWIVFKFASLFTEAILTDRKIRRIIKRIGTWANLNSNCVKALVVQIVKRICYLFFEFFCSIAIFSKRLKFVIRYPNRFDV